MIFLNHSVRDSDLAALIRKKFLTLGCEVEKGSYTKILSFDETKEFPKYIYKRRPGEIKSDVILNILTSGFFKSKLTVKELNDAMLSNKYKIITLAFPDIPVPDYLNGFLQFKLKSHDEEELLEVVSNIASHLKSDEPISSSEATEINKTENKTNTLDRIKVSMNSGKLTLFCGAGTSYDAGIPTWDKLLENLFSEMLKSMKGESEDLRFDISAVEASGITEKASALIIAKYIKNNLKDKFQETLRKALYKENPDTCPVIESIVELARPRRDGKSIDSIITFNFDCLFEEQLSKSSISHKAIHSESIKCSQNELPIYHVHGFLPRHKDVNVKGEVVFSEDGYHSQFIEPYSWSNIIQIQKLTQNTCLFIGVSLTDPNMRRLLDVAWRKTSDDTPSHFIIKKKPSSENIEAKKFIMYLDEQDANELGLNVIWVNDFNEIPDLLNSFLK